MTNPELYLLKAFIADSSLFHRFHKYIKPEQREIQEIYVVLTSIYQNPEITHTSLAEIKLALYHKNTEQMSFFISQLESCDIEASLPTVLKVLSEYKKQAIAHKLALEALAVSEGHGSLEKVKALAADIQEDVQFEVEKEFVNDELSELHEHSIATPGLRWRLRSLNRSLGSLRGGDFGFIFARPESGKTTFLASEVTFFAGQTDKPILWFNNEEQGSKVSIRCYQAALGCTSQQLFSNIPENQRRYRELTGNRIKIYDSASISKADVTRVCEQYGPALILFDQIDKIKGFEADRDDIKLGAIYQWAREIAKRYAPTIAVTQADGSGEGKKWLTMENVSGAKTSKQAEADWILGIGKSHDDGLQYVRHINISKNKLLGDENTDPQLRHGKFDVIIEPEIARYKDI